MSGPCAEKSHRADDAVKTLDLTPSSGLVFAGQTPERYVIEGTLECYDVGYDDTVARALIRCDGSYVRIDLADALYLSPFDGKRVRVTVEMLED